MPVGREQLGRASAVRTLPGDVARQLAFVNDRATETGRMWWARRRVHPRRSFWAAPTTGPPVPLVAATLVAHPVVAGGCHGRQAAGIAQEAGDCGRECPGDSESFSRLWLAIGRGLWNGGRRGRARVRRRRSSLPSDPQKSSAAAVAQPETVEINIAYGTEKQQWLEAATAEFHKTTTGSSIVVNLHGMGSMEGAQAVLDGPAVDSDPRLVARPLAPTAITSNENGGPSMPTSRPSFEDAKPRSDPDGIRDVGRPPQAFLKKYAKVNFQTLARAMAEPGGWGTIAGEADWGRFKFGHTHPGQSNSGLLALVLLAYEFSHKEYNLSRKMSAIPGSRLLWKRSNAAWQGRGARSLTAREL